MGRAAPSFQHQEHETLTRSHGKVPATLLVDVAVAEVEVEEVDVEDEDVLEEDSDAVRTSVALTWGPCSDNPHGHERLATWFA